MYLIVEADEAKLSSAGQDILRQELMDALMIEHNLFYDFPIGASLIQPAPTDGPTRTDVSFVLG